MDHLDREILSQLVKDGRMSYRDLGASVGLSSNAAAERVRRLRRAGVITGFTALIDPAAGEPVLEALIEVRMRPGNDPDAFERELAAIPTVVEVLHLSGRADYQLRTVCRDPRQLDGLIRDLKGRLGVVETETRLVLRPAIRASAPPPA